MIEEERHSAPKFQHTDIPTFENQLRTQKNGVSSFYCPFHCLTQADL